MKDKKWITAGIKQSIKHKNRIYKKWLKHTVIMMKKIIKITDGCLKVLYIKQSCSCLGLAAYSFIFRLWLYCLGLAAYSFIFF